jgi:acyl carrier protein
MSGGGVPDEVLLAAFRRVLDIGDEPGATSIGPNSRLAELDVDSLLMAELIVELEELLAVFLEFRLTGPLETVADFGRAVTPIVQETGDVRS